MKKTVTLSNGIETREIKIGLSWPGFFFNSFWALFKGLWGYTLFIWFFSIVISLVTMEDQEMMLISSNIWGLIWSLYFLFKGNQLQINRLLKMGWKVTQSPVQQQTVPLQPVTA